MKKSMISKKQLVLIIFLMPLFLVAQNSAQNDGISTIKSEKLAVVFQSQSFLGASVTMFNKNTTKVKLGNYADAKITRKSGSSSTTKILGVSYSETKSNFSIDSATTLNENSKITGTKKESNILTIIEATLNTNQKDAKTWNLYLRLANTVFLNKDKEDRITDGTRTINIIPVNFCRFENRAFPPETVFYEFIENGVTLGAVTFGTENSIWLQPDLDATTKLIVSTAMVSIAN